MTLLRGGLLTRHREGGLLTRQLAVGKGGLVPIGLQRGHLQLSSFTIEFNSTELIESNSISSGIDPE